MAFMVLVRGCGTSSRNTAGFLGFMAHRWEAASTSADLFFWFSNLPLSVERAAHQWALPVYQFGLFFTYGLVKLVSVEPPYAQWNVTRGIVPL
jgi:hypothetical protein